MSETWTPKTEQSETWANQAPSLIRAFSPYGFARTPDFSTGSTAGIWDERTEQAETWTEAG